MLTTEDMAAALIGTKAVPSGAKALAGLAQGAWVYHNLKPYPLYHFQTWLSEDRGPLPRCLPLAKSIVKCGARFLFGKPLQLTCAGNDACEEFLKSA